MLIFPIKKSGDARPQLFCFRTYVLNLFLFFKFQGRPFVPPCGTCLQHSRTGLRPFSKRLDPTQRFVSWHFSAHRCRSRRILLNNFAVRSETQLKPADPRRALSPLAADVRLFVTSRDANGSRDAWRVFISKREVRWRANVLKFEKFCDTFSQSFSRFFFFFHLFAALRRFRYAKHLASSHQTQTNSMASKSRRNGKIFETKTRLLTRFF